MRKIFILLSLVIVVCVNAQTSISCADARTAALSVSANNEEYNNGALYVVRGYVTSIQTAWSSQYNNVSFWMADTENGGQVIQAYRCVANTQADAPNVGALVEVTGKLTKYYSTPEIAAGCTCQIITATEAPVNLGLKTISEFLSLQNTKDTCVLRGIVNNIVMDSNDETQYNPYGNFYLEEIGNAGVSVYIYGLLTASLQSRQFCTMDIDAGDTLTIKAVYTEYNGNPQVSNAIYVSHSKYVDGEEPDPIATGSLRVCAQNLENYYYNYNASSRPSYSDEAGFREKTVKIVNNMLAIDADIYAFCEVEAKPIVLAQLADSMNAHAGVAGRYMAVSDGIDYTIPPSSDNQIKSGFIYRTDKVATYGSNTSAVYGNGYYAHTMRIQAFKQLSNNEKFVVSMNHFKAKDNSVDAGESIRLGNANNLVSALDGVSSDPDILILGDLNCQVGEEPMNIIINAGYEEQLLKFDANAYSHCYGGGELIDHVLANSSMADQIVKAYVKHVSTYRCTPGVTQAMSYSDHDPYVVEITLGGSSVGPVDPETPCEDKDETYLTSEFAPMTTDGEATWTWDNSYNCAKVTMQGGKTGYMFTPAMNMANVKSVSISFEHTHKFAGIPEEELTLWVTPDFQGDFESSEWQPVTITPYASNNDWKFVTASMDVPVANVGENTVFAFKYMSTESNYGTWELKNLHITATCGQLSSENIMVKPNTEAIKTIENGQLLLTLPDGTKYNVIGLRIR